MIPIANLRLADVMDRQVFCVSHDDTIAGMVAQMKLRHVSHVVVVEDGRAIGMLTERDLVRLLHQKVDRSRSVAEFMSKPVATVSGALGFRSAYIQLCLSRLRHLVVVDNAGAVIGVAAERDFLGHLGMELFQNVRSLRDLIDRSVPRLPADLPVVDAIDQMVRERRGCVVVAQDDRYLGIFTEDQIPTVLARHEDGSPVPLGEVMRKTVKPVTESVSIAEIMAQLVSDRIGYVVVVDPDGRIMGTIAQTHLLESVRTAVYAEMATRQLVEDQLLQVEAQLEATLEHTPNIAVQWYDSEGCIRYWNHASEEMYGYTAIEAMGKPLDQLVMSSSEAAEFKRLLGEVAVSGKTYGPKEYEIRDRQGRARWVEATLFPIPGENPGETFFVCMDVDISRRKKAELELRASEERFRSVSTSATDAIILIDSDGKVMMWNAAASRMFGYDTDEVLGRDLHQLLAPACYEEAWRAGLQKFRDSGQGNAIGKTTELTALRKNGQAFPIELSLSAMQDGGRWVGVGIARDITERRNINLELEQHRDHLESLVAKRTEELAAAKEVAESAAVAKSQFLANMSHEIRTPLNGILGLARIAIRENHGRKSGQLSRKILRSGQHLMGIIDDILDFSKIEAGRLTIDPHPMSLAFLAEEACSLVADRAADKLLTLEKHLAVDLPPRVLGDSLRIRQILVNFLSNAIKFTETGSIRLVIDRAGEAIRFAIADTGIGMSEEEVSQLFQPFQQADATITRKYGGTGLGLAISKNLADMMGGTITVTSTPGQGSTFALQLSLPVTDQMPTSEILGSHATGRPLEGIRILAAEDVEINREVLEDLLREAGASITLVKNGKEAVDCVTDHPADFDIVLMDIQMPVMDGREASRRIRQIVPRLPVIALTAHALHEERQQSLEAGMVGHLNKPIEPSALVREVLAHCKMPARPLPANSSPIEPGGNEVTAMPIPPGLDTEQGLRFTGSPDRYRRTLAKFAAQHDKDGHRIRDSLAQGNADEARRIAHGAKSVATMIGATALAQAALELELAIKSAGGAPAGLAESLACLDTFEALLSPLVAAIGEGASARLRAPQATGLSS